MNLKHYAEVKPTPYEGLSEGVEIREMITDRDGAPHFALRVFDLRPGASTPFHTHEWEHEVYILRGAGVVRSGGLETPFTQGDSIFIPANERHCFVAGPDLAVQFICVIPSKHQCTL